MSKNSLYVYSSAIGLEGSGIFSLAAIHFRKKVHLQFAEESVEVCCMSRVCDAVRAIFASREEFKFVKKQEWQLANLSCFCSSVAYLKSGGFCWNSVC